MKHLLPPQLDKKHTSEYLYASSYGRGSHKKLCIVTTVNGYGYSLVEFVVTDHEDVFAYQVLEAAIIKYNECK